MLNDRVLQRLTTGLGLGTVAFGVGAFVAPRLFAAWFGLPTDGPANDVAIRSVGARDAISGIGILSAIFHGGRVAPWLLARGLADGTDAIGVGIAWLAGARSQRLELLGIIAVAATIGDVFLYIEHKHRARQTAAVGGT